jgi:hypothetical protein
MWIHSVAVRDGWCWVVHSHTWKKDERHRRQVQSTTTGVQYQEYRVSLVQWCLTFLAQPIIL